MIDEPKPDRLLTDEELIRVSGDAALRRSLPSKTSGQSYIYRIAQAQDAKTASIMRAECQERVKRIIRELWQVHASPSGNLHLALRQFIQALKEGVK